ncbi:MAG: ArsR/SmtB family transcription factor [Pseudonocardiaceae bacterium]
MAEDAAAFSQVFKALADPVRLRLLSLIGAHEDGEVCVCDLVDAFHLSQPTISYHLKVLRSAGLITSRRRATWMYYRINADAVQRLSELVGGALAGWAGTTPTV